MCELIGIVRVVVFFICASLIVGGVLSSYIFCRRRGIDMNKFSGMFEMYRRIFLFENKSFSIFMFLCMYGSAALILGIFFLTQWGVGQGCNFPLVKSKTW